MKIPNTYPGEARTLGYLLRAPYQKLVRRLYGQLAAEGFPDIRPSHGAVLRNLDREGSRLTELAESADLTKQSMAYLVDNLQKAGYLSTEPDPADGRAKIVRLTERGENLLQVLLRISAAIEKDIACSTGDAFISQLRQSLLRLDDALGVPGASPR